ncbi:hypothetical protein HYX19_01100, partial [Candidatus Woesearchaeota archaeon]|nr:hypothetical protein [Candidatus Woesearchaeota archaeon]
MPVTTIKNNETETLLGQPQAVVYLNGKEKSIPLKCLYFEGKLFEYNKGLDGCLRVIPEINGNKINKIGAVLYLSPRVKRTLFANLYLFDGKDYPNFELVYSDDKRSPLALSRGNQYGPLRV